MRSWLAEARDAAGSGAAASPVLLVLYGGPGVGKSTMVSLLAAEAGFDVRVWADEGARGGSGRAWRDGGGPDGGDLTFMLDQWTGVHDGAGGALGGSAAYMSVAEDFANALKEATLFPSLLLAPAATDAGGAARRTRGAAAGERGPAAPSLLLLDSVPSPARPEARALVHQALAAFARRGRHAAVLVMSDGGGGREAAGETASALAVRRAIGDAAANSPRVKIME